MCSAGSVCKDVFLKRGLECLMQSPSEGTWGEGYISTKNLAAWTARMHGKIRETMVWLPCRERSKCPFEDLVALWLAKDFKRTAAITDAPIGWKIYLLIRPTFAGQ